jgi:hypothetical protein
MTRRTWLVVAGAVVLVAISAALLMLRPNPNARITWENFEYIHEGMSRAEAEAILGTPGDYTTAPMEGRNVTVCLATSMPGAEVPFSQWHGNEGSIRLMFDLQDRLTWGVFDGCGPVDMGRLNILLWRIKRQWQRWFPE